MEITITIGHFGSSSHTGSRGKDYSATAPFPKGGETNAPTQFPFQTPSVLRLSLPKFLRPHPVYTPAASVMIFLLVLGGVFVLPSFLSKPDPFPALCDGNFHSANTSVNTIRVPTPTTSTSPDGQPIGLSEGATIFDLQRSNQQEVQYKLQAAQAATNDLQNVVPSSLKNALSIDPTDAEAQIYLENWRVLGSNHSHITMVVTVSFGPTPAGASRATLQGAFTAQKECNHQSQQDSSKMQIVLMIANIGGNTIGDRANSATFVANQIADQAVKDPTIVGIMCCTNSTNSINVNHQFKIRGSHLPMISPSASSDELQGMSNFFRVCPPNKEEAQLAANFLLNSQHKKRIAVLYDATTSYANNLKDDFAQDIPHNMVGSPEPFKGGKLDTVQNALTNALARMPDAIFFSGQASDLFALLNDISSTPTANLLIVGGDAVASTSVYTSLPPNMGHVYFMAFGSPNQWDDTNTKPPLFGDYQANFGTVTDPYGLPSIDAAVMLSYDATLALIHGSQLALSIHNTINALYLTEALRQITAANPIQGVTGRIAFSSNGNPEKNKIILVEHIQGTSLKIDDRQGCFLVTDNCG